MQEIIQRLAKVILGMGREVAPEASGLLTNHYCHHYKLLLRSPKAIFNARRADIDIEGYPLSLSAGKLKEKFNDVAIDLVLALQGRPWSV